MHNKLIKEFRLVIGKSTFKPNRTFYVDPQVPSRGYPINRRLGYNNISTGACVLYDVLFSFFFFYFSTSYMVMKMNITEMGIRCDTIFSHWLSRFSPTVQPRSPRQCSSFK